ncbi:hypothetical protein [Prauserella muralis]|nr:hypothetical protein [Prauserella muralis]
MLLWHINPADVGRMTLRDFWMSARLADELLEASEQEGGAGAG